MITDISAQSLSALLRTLAKQVEEGHPDTPTFSLCLANGDQSIASGRYEPDPLKLLELLEWQIKEIHMRQYIHEMYE